MVSEFNNNSRTSERANAPIVRTSHLHSSFRNAGRINDMIYAIVVYAFRFVEIYDYRPLKMCSWYLLGEYL